MRPVILMLSLVFACGQGDSPIDPIDGTFTSGESLNTEEENAILSLVNDGATDLERLDIDAKLNKRAAQNIIAHRNGSDGDFGTADDDLFDNLGELDAVKYVGESALRALLEYAMANGYGGNGSSDLAVIFSPQPENTSHNARVRELIDGAQHTIDIAMYSYSDAGIGDALEDAIDRGVSVRFLFETANSDRRKEGSDFENSKSARLERAGIDVRYVNKIMHHKYAIIDGPRGDLSRADTGWVVSGSANWSWGGASRYDENTVFMRGVNELALRMQAEFDHLWNHSRDFTYDDSLEYVTNPVISDSEIPDEPDFEAYMTSDNFDIGEGTTTFRVTGRNTVSDAMVAAIEGADESIQIASGHLRSRPVSEALMAKAANSDVSIEVLLDGQEYISSSYHASQIADREECVEEAGDSQSKIRKCYDRGFKYGYQVGQTSGIDVRYKHYSYRWHYSYAVQMHNKYMIIDGDELWTGSYNLSDNAEHNTFENMLVFRGPRFASIVGQYVQSFNGLWEMERGTSALEDLREEIQTADSIPLVYDAMSLTWSEVRDLKALIAANCSDINSEDFRRNPQNHQYCER